MDKKMLMNQGSDTERLWSIVLAGGEGERLRPFVQQWLGRHQPKQYCTFVGTRSMFQHTVDRADQLSAPDHRVTVIASGLDRRIQVASRERFCGKAKHRETQGCHGCWSSMEHPSDGHPGGNPVENGMAVFSGNDAAV